MGVKDRVLVGELDTPIKIIGFTNAQDVDTNADLRTELPEPIGTVLMQRMTDNRVSGGEFDEGKVEWLNGRIYRCRFIKFLALRGVEYVLRDFDGDFEINDVNIIGRNQWLVLKCSKRE